MILPRNGRIACVALFLPCFAEPPAESPSTKNTSESVGSFSEQSASFPGNDHESSAPFLRVNSRAFRAASRATAAFKHFSITTFALPGFSSKYVCNVDATTLSVIPFTSEFPNFAFVCPSNCGSGTLTEITAVKPSSTSSEEHLTPLAKLFLSAY